LQLWYQIVWRIPEFLQLNLPHLNLPTNPWDVCNISYSLRFILSFPQPYFFNLLSTESFHQLSTLMHLRDIPYSGLFLRGVYFPDCYEIILRFSRKIIFWIVAYTHPGLAALTSVVYPCSDHEDYDIGTASTSICTANSRMTLCRAEGRDEHRHDQSGKN
jgi:hypothetical protein